MPKCPRDNSNLEFRGLRRWYCKMCNTFYRGRVITGKFRCPTCKHHELFQNEENGTYICQRCGGIFKQPQLLPSTGFAPGTTPPAPTPPTPTPTPTAPSRGPGFSHGLRALIFILATGIIAFYPVQIPFLEQFIYKFIALVVLAVINQAWNNNIPATVIIGIIIVVWFFTQTPAGQGMAEQIGIREQIDEAVLGVKYSGCYMTNAFNVNILSGGNLNEFCYMQVYGFKVTKEGCKDCITFTPTPRRTGIPLQPVIVEIPISLESNSNSPAKNINLKIIDLDSGREGTIINDKCTLEKPCKLASGDPDIQVRASLILPCKNSIEYKTIVGYDYVVEGQAEFRIKNGEYSTKKLGEAMVEGSSSSGPMSFGIKSDTLEYIVGEDREVFVNFYLFNEGRGVVKPKKTTVTQVTPKDTAALELEECQGLAKVVPIDSTHFDIESYGSIPSNGGDMIQCRFKLPESVTVPYLTYKFIGVTDYSYSYDKKDSIMIDLVNYPCSMTGSRWKFMSGSVSMDWFSSSFDDSVWSLVDLPDGGWSDGDRYYRKVLVLPQTFGKTWLNVSSDDGAECYVNGNSVFSDIGSTHEHGKKNCGLIGAITGCSYWDYSNDLTSYLKEGTNLIACHVHNVEGKGWFEVQT